MISLNFSFPSAAASFYVSTTKMHAFTWEKKILFLPIFRSIKYNRSPLLFSLNTNYSLYLLLQCVSHCILVSFKIVVFFFSLVPTFHIIIYSIYLSIEKQNVNLQVSLYQRKLKLYSIAPSGTHSKFENVS